MGRERDSLIPALEGQVELAEAAGLGGLLFLPTAPALELALGCLRWPVCVRRDADAAGGVCEQWLSLPSRPVVPVSLHVECPAGCGQQTGTAGSFPEWWWSCRNSAEGEAGKGSRKSGAEM